MGKWGRLKLFVVKAEKFVLATFDISNVLKCLRQGTQVKDVVIKPDAPSALLLDKHADYIAAYGSKKDDYVSRDIRARFWVELTCYTH